jgi:hypothetical protein
MDRKITGIQLHHSTFLDDAGRGGANLVAGLTNALGRTGSAEYEALLTEARMLIVRVAQAQVDAANRLRELGEHDPVQFARCRDGDAPWPDERPEGFVARCRCDDRCLVHDHGRGEPERDCNCDIPCAVHG